MDFPIRDDRPDEISDLIREVRHDVDVPVELGRLPDGREAWIIGDLQRFADLGHQQGEVRGFKGTCGLCACECVLRMFGLDVREIDMIKYAIEHGLCEVTGKPDTMGGTTSLERVQILEGFGVEATTEVRFSLEELAQDVEQGKGVILGVNAHRLHDLPAAPWNRWMPNHAVTVIAEARDPRTDDLLGFFINDSGTGSNGMFVDAHRLADAWLGMGGLCEVTTVSYQDHTDGKVAA